MAPLWDGLSPPWVPTVDITSREGRIVRVSVVVPIYNPGRYFDKCIASLLNQSLSAADYEIVLVDDGSTDETPARLDQLARQHTHIRVLHEPNSGWAGRPRNVGVRHAQGEYVQFVDQDDELNLEALERLYAIAHRNFSDIVLGKIGGTMQGPSNVYARTVERCTVDTAKLFESLPPHKMFRRQFLLDENIRFPEGRVRLEDQLFMSKAYLRAKVVSIIGDYVCYYWMRRDDGGNTSSQRVTPRDYFGYLAGVLDVIAAETQPGPQRDACMSRFFRVEMMTRMREPTILRCSDGYRKESYRAIRELALQHFQPPSRAIDHLAPTMRLRAHLLLHDRLDSLMALAERHSGDVRPKTTVQQALVSHGRLQVKLTAELTHRDGSPVVVIATPKGYLLDPRFTQGIKGVPKRGWDVGNPLDHTDLEFRVHDPAAQTAWYPDTKVKASLQHVQGNQFKVVLTGKTTIDPRHIGPGLGHGIYEVKIRCHILGHGPSAHPTGPLGPLTITVGVDGRAESVPDPGRIGQLRLRILASPTVRQKARTVLRGAPTPVTTMLRRLSSRV
jgi:glycosyltransferase involved in cell wall biosynthesis